MATKKQEAFVKWWTGAAGLNEIYQTNKIQFAFLASPTEGSKQCHPWVLCRDFLHDAVKATLTETTQSIYGFIFNGTKNPPVDVKKMRMLIRHTEVKERDAKKTTEYEKDRIHRALALIHRFEKVGKLSKTKIERIQKTKDGIPVWLLVGSKKWVRSPFMLSMYTYLIRLGTDPNLMWDEGKPLTEILSDTASKNKSGGGNDMRYLQTHHDKLEKIMAAHKELFYPANDLDPSYSDVDVMQTFHDRSGILNLCKFQSTRKGLEENVRKILAKKVLAEKK